MSISIEFLKNTSPNPNVKAQEINYFFKKKIQQSWWYKKRRLLLAGKFRYPAQRYLLIRVFFKI